MNGFFFFRRKNNSGHAAGERLRQVIINDRACSFDNTFAEKIRKEIISLVNKYYGDEGMDDRVRVTAISGNECTLKVKVPLKIK